MRETGTATISYRQDNLLKKWSVGYLVGQDTEDDIREHFYHWIQNGEFISVQFDPSKFQPIDSWDEPI